MAKPLLLKPELNLLLTQCTNREAELDALISLDARRQFAEERGIIVTQTETPEMVYSKLDGISIQDSVFTGWLIEKLGQTNSMVSTLDLCKKITNKAALENALLEMHQSRDKHLLASFVKAGIAPERLRISDVQVTDLPLIELPRYKYEINVDENKTE